MADHAKHSSPMATWRLDIDEDGDTKSLSGFGRPLFACLKEKEDNHVHDWRELQEIEKQRRAILKRVELPFGKILSFWDGTCLRLLSRDRLFWSTLGIYGFLRIHARIDENLPHFVETLQNTDIGIIGGFLSFFLVLFVNQSNARFNQMYKESMECERRIFDIATLTTTAFPKSHAARLVRYLNAAHAAGYVGLSRTYSKEAFFDQLNKIYKFLTPEEMVRINELQMEEGGDCFREILTWCMMDIQTAETQKIIDVRLSSMLKEKVLLFRANMDSIYDYTDQPIHFFYIHFLSLLSVFYLPLFAVDSAYSAGVGEEAHWFADILSGLIVMLQAIFVIGLRLLGQKMIDPYGDDEEDLSVIHYVLSSWKSSNRILQARYPTAVSDQEEEEMTLSSASLGVAWAAQSLRQRGSHSPIEGKIV